MNQNDSHTCQTGAECIKCDEQLFYNLPDIVKPTVVAALLGISIKTIYDWRYRQEMRSIPSDLFIKLNRMLYIRKSALKRWINSQNRAVL